MASRTLKITGAVTALIVVGTLAVGANAFGRHWGGGMMMRHMDANGDGKVTRAEIMPRLTRKFDKFDANGDGCALGGCQVMVHITQRRASVMPTGGAACGIAGNPPWNLLDLGSGRAEVS